jgi:dTDP-4-amino-4,6-dideoxygalactose transaminase
VFHFVPLHSSPAGKRLGRSPGPLPVTDQASDRLLRLPLWFGMGEADVERVVGAVAEVV